MTSFIALLRSRGKPDQGPDGTCCAPSPQSQSFLVPSPWSLFPGPYPLPFHFTRALARAATFSAVNPSSAIAFDPGAEAPNRSRPITSPSRPTSFHQPIGDPASTASRGTPAGSTLALYSAVCSSKISQLGKLTTRAAMPSAASSLAASTHGHTSEPVPISTILGSGASSRTYPPLLTPA